VASVPPLTLANLWNAFPTHTAYPTMQDLYTWLGGNAAANINAPGFGPNGNTCASRLSVAFNNTSSQIGTNTGLSTLGTASGQRILYRVSEFRTFLLNRLGAPLVDTTSPFNSSFLGKKGIIAFTVNFADASGHIALWNGSAFREPVHDDYSSYVNGSVKTSKGEFWQLP
jgi:Type VI secretion system (T6SS), amidase effector protein 4